MRKADAFVAGLVAAVLGSGCLGLIRGPRVNQEDIELVINSVKTNGKRFEFTDFISERDFSGTEILEFRRVFKKSGGYAADLYLAELQASSSGPDTLNGVQWFYYDRLNKALIAYCEGGADGQHLEVGQVNTFGHFVVIGEVEPLDRRNTRIDGNPEAFSIVAESADGFFERGGDYLVLSNMILVSKLPKRQREIIRTQYQRFFRNYKTE